MASGRTDISDGTPPWRGFHHVALVTPDLEATIRFYGEVLGMRVGEVVGATERQGCHCFIKPGDVETWGRWVQPVSATVLASVAAGVL